MLLISAELRADTFIINDLTDSLSVTQIGSSLTAAVVVIGESVEITLFGPVGVASVASASSVTIAEPSEPTLVSDRFVFTSAQTGPDWFVSFASDFDSVIHTCAEFGGCQMVEDGAIQTAGEIIWSDGTTAFIQFQSDVSEVPEPSSMLLLLSGFAGLGLRKLRSRVVRRATPAS